MMEKVRAAKCQSREAAACWGPTQAVLRLCFSVWGPLLKLPVITCLNRCSHFRSLETCQLGKVILKVSWLAAPCSGEAFFEPVYPLGPWKEKQDKRKQEISSPGFWRQSEPLNSRKCQCVVICILNVTHFWHHLKQERFWEPNMLPTFLLSCLWSLYFREGLLPYNFAQAFREWVKEHP